MLFIEKLSQKNQPDRLWQNLKISIIDCMEIVSNLIKFLWIKLNQGQYLMKNLVREQKFLYNNLDGIKMILKKFGIFSLVMVQIYL